MNNSKCGVKPTCPVSVLIAAKNEAANLGRCLTALAGWADEVVVVDSGSTDATAAIAESYGAQVLQFSYDGGRRKKRQWALDTHSWRNEWILLLDADEVVPVELSQEIAAAVVNVKSPSAFMITKGFHFLGKRFRFGGFSFAAVLLVRLGRARFEQTFSGGADGLDMEVHERLIVDGPIGRLCTPLIHEDFKGLQAYIDRHNKYSTWEAGLRLHCLESGRYGEKTIQPRLFGNSQERRRFLKNIIMRLPFESWLWFAYHYFCRLGFLEGRPGLIASQIRAAYIQQVQAKMFELRSTHGSKKSDVNRQVGAAVGCEVAAQ